MRLIEKLEMINQIYFNSRSIFKQEDDRIVRSFVLPGYENVPKLNVFRHLNKWFIRCLARLRMGIWQEHNVRHIKRTGFWGVILTVQPEYKPVKGKQ